MRNLKVVAAQIANDQQVYFQDIRNAFVEDMDIAYADGANFRVEAERIYLARARLEQKLREKHQQRMGILPKPKAIQAHNDPHKYLKAAFAQGAKIQRLKDRMWIDTPNPRWDPAVTYRIIVDLPQPDLGRHGGL